MRKNSKNASELIEWTKNSKLVMREPSNLLFLYDKITSSKKMYIFDTLMEVIFRKKENYFP